MRLEAFDRLTNLAITDNRMATIGGVVYRVLDRVPKEGDVVDLAGCRATVVEMDGMRISKLRIAKTGSTTGDVEGDELSFGRANEAAADDEPMQHQSEQAEP
jgi:CBS domain containing-hemolysin-like protein